MESTQAVRIELADFRTRPMRAFHTTWMAFFVCFFSWFAVAPLMPIVRDRFGLTKTQMGNAVIASVAVTFIARLIVGRILDRFGPRRTYAALLFLGAIPVVGIGLAETYPQFLAARLAVGFIGASFVITQYHTSVMFAPNVVGTANAVTAGWGNLGGGVTQIAMPLVLAGLASLGMPHAIGYRVAMVLPATLLVVMGILYLRNTTDVPEGNYPEVKRDPGATAKAPFREALSDPRVLVLAIAYAACFGVELTINNVAATYFHDHFGLGLTAAGMVAGLHGLMNLFARALGGIGGDRAGIRHGLRGRVLFLAAILLLESVALLGFSRAHHLGPAIALLVVFSLFVEMACGATFSVVPMVNRKALGSVSGVVGAGGNLGAVAAGFLFRSESIHATDAFLAMGVFVLVAGLLVPFVGFSEEEEAAAQAALERSLREREALAAVPAE